MWVNDLGVDVESHEDTNDVEGEWEDEVNVRKPLEGSRDQSPSQWANDSFVEETQDPISSWVQVEDQRHNHTIPMIINLGPILI